MDDPRFMELALAEASVAAQRGDVPVGSVLVKDGAVLARAANEKTIDPTAHAEMRVIRLAAEKLGHWNLSGCDLYVTLEPCAMCAGACVSARVRRIVFGAYDLKAGAAGSLYNIPRDVRLNHLCGVCGGVLQERCASILQEYFLQRRKKSYSCA